MGNVSVNVKMKTAFALLAVACFAAFASANPVERTSCSITELLNCQNEINQAMTDCSHLNSRRDPDLHQRHPRRHRLPEVHLRRPPWSLRKALNKNFAI